MSQIIEERHELEQSRIIVDPRSFGKKIWDSLEKPWLPMAWAILSSALVVVWPAMLFPMFFVFLILLMAVSAKPDVLPIHLPMDANKVDLHDPKPGENRGHYISRGAFYIGKVRKTGYEVWASFKALTQHFLIFGTTGAGKTESIVSYIVNCLSVGSGVAFQDAKAAPKAMIQMATLCRIFGRDDDFRVTNYITGMTAESRDPAERISNDAAIFARGAPESNTQLLVSLLPPSGGDNKIFAERAVALVSAIMPALTDLRELGKIQIDPGVVRKHMAFKVFVELFRNNQIKMRSRNALQAFLESLPGFDETKDITKQPEEVTRQFGFAQAYFTRSLASLSDTYGHIYLVGMGEIDYQDAVLNGRVLMTLLPSLEKSGEELAALGKIVLTALRNGMVVGLGTKFEGSADDIVHNLPTNSDIPYLIFNDENAYMLVEGQEMINAQARGLGFGIFTGTQDAPGMLENISRTTKQIMANSAFKQIMYLDDKETTDLAVEFAGEAHVMVRSSFETKGDMGNIYNSQNVAVERRNRLNSTAIKRQGLGQAYLMYQGHIHETQVFNHGIAERHKDPRMAYLSHWYSVRMAKVRLPDEEMLNTLLMYSDRQDWRELKLIINDNSMAMLKEMKSYFSSMIQINRIAEIYKNEPELQRMAYSDVLGQEEAPAVGGLLGLNQFGMEVASEDEPSLIDRIVSQPPNGIKAALRLVMELSKTKTGEMAKLAREAEEAGLSLFNPDTPEHIVDVVEDDTSGSGGGGGLQSSTDPESTDLLDAYLGAEATALTGPDEQITDELGESLEATMAAEAATPLLAEPLTPIGQAVSANLQFMPWMASQAEYDATQESLTQTEMLFTDDPALASAEAQRGMDLLGSHLSYPNTSIQPGQLDPDIARKLLSSHLNKN